MPRRLLPGITGLCFVAGMEELRIVLYLLLLLAREIFCRDRATDVERRARRQRHIEVAAMRSVSVVLVVIRQFVGIIDGRYDLLGQRHKIIWGTGDSIPIGGVLVFRPGFVESVMRCSPSATSSRFKEPTGIYPHEAIIIYFK